MTLKDIQEKNRLNRLEELKAVMRFIESASAIECGLIIERIRCVHNNIYPFNEDTRLSAKIECVVRKDLLDAKRYPSCTHYMLDSEWHDLKFPMVSMDFEITCGDYDEFYNMLIQHPKTMEYMGVYSADFEFIQTLNLTKEMKNEQ